MFATRAASRDAASVMSKLLKTRIRGGILTVTDRELVLGEGWLGTQNVKRFPIYLLVAVELQPSPSERPLHRSMVLRLVWGDGTVTDVDGVGPIAAQRIRDILTTLGRTDTQ